MIGVGVLIQVGVAANNTARRHVSDVGKTGINLFRAGVYILSHAQIRVLVGKKGMPRPAQHGRRSNEKNAEGKRHPRYGKKPTTLVGAHGRNHVEACYQKQRMLPCERGRVNFHEY